MRQVALGLLCLALNACSNAGAEPVEDWQVVEARRQAARETFSRQLPTLKPTRLFRIDPIDGYPVVAEGGLTWRLPRFHGWGVAASAAPSDANAEAAISRSLSKIVSAHKDGQDACFSPHHGVTLTNGRESFDVLLCFDCSQYVVYTLDGTTVFADSFNARQEMKTWEQVFRASGLPDSKRRKGRRLTPRSSGRGGDKVPSPKRGARAAQLNR